MNTHLNVFYRVSEKWPQLDYHSHQEFEIFFFHSGECRYVISNNIYDLVPGDILMMDGMALHKANVPEDSTYTRSILHFSPQWIKGVLKEVGGLHLLDVFKQLQHCLLRTYESEDAQELEKLFCKLEEVNRTSFIERSSAELEEKVILLQILIAVNKIYEKNTVRTPTRKSEKDLHSVNIADYVQANYMEKLTLDSIAANLNLSKSYVSHVFKEMTGFTVMEYVMAYRLTQVKYLIEMKPDKTLKEIAFECGFESIPHFSRYFKEKVGVTARKFREDRLNIYQEEKRL